MAILEDLLEEMKRLNKNLQVTNVELSTVDETTLKEVVKEAPMKKAKEEDETKVKKTVYIGPEPEQEMVSEDKTYTKEEVLNLGKQFIQNVDDNDKKAFKTKLEELGAGKLSSVSEDNFNEIVNFMNARLTA
ncbi:hypothetical protein CD110_03830 [Staphylococcus casei]|uniref:hypothetical protein n=1 Tax=Staphylococcus casei TaxID=201828 RepID=UPI000CD2FBBB|nr:hypothetical protein [Staphylococcus casei]PNZ60910.1 hypothetical protein CD110_03830 [Staphylococcus casei]WJE87398.1 hypothetical protein QMO72_05510 [Staphylococcus casei]